MSITKTWNFNTDTARATLAKLDAASTASTAPVFAPRLVYPRPLLLKIGGAWTWVQPAGAPYIRDSLPPVSTSTASAYTAITYGPRVPSPRPLCGCYPLARPVHTSTDTPRRRLMDSTIKEWDAYTASPAAAVAVLLHHAAHDAAPVWYKRVGDKRRQWAVPVATLEYGQPIDFAPVPTTTAPKKDAARRGQSTYKAPTYEQNSSADAKNAAPARQFGPVEQIALRCAIGALKNAIAPRGKNINAAAPVYAAKDAAPVCYYDEQLERCVSEKIELPAAKGDEKGTYTATMRLALASLQRFAHSKVQAVPDDYTAQELYSTALLHLYNAAYLLQTAPAVYVTGYTNGFAVLHSIHHGPRAGTVQTGPRAVYAMCSAAVSTYIRGERKHADKTFSIDHISQGSDFDAPEKYDIPDFRSISRQQAKELGHAVTLALKSTAKTPADAAENIAICNALIKGYTQTQIAKQLGHTQGWVAKRVAKIRLALIPLLH